MSPARRDPTRRAFVASLSLVAAAALAAPAAAQVDVLLCAAAGGGPSDCRFLDVQSKLMASGFFASVGIFDANAGTPTLPILAPYEVVLVWSNSAFQDATLLGDTLADYVDAGGAVVVSVFAVSQASTSLSLQGRWQTGYEVILDQSGTTSFSVATLGTIHVPGHPILNGVATFDGGSASYRPTGTALEAGAIPVADWSDGRVLVAEGANPRRVDLGFYPPSNACFSHFWDQSTDGHKLLANAVLHAATASGNCTGNVTSYCTPSTTTNGCNPVMGASGTPSAAASSGFTLTCSNVEGQRSGLIFYGVSGPVANPWGVGSTSTVCVKAPTQRTLVHLTGGSFNACDGQLSIDWLAFMAANPGALGQPLAQGHAFHAQAWFRDPPAVKTTNLSDGLRFLLCP
jgi:hypothetical protein